jgi:hypothetical protein
MRVSRRLCRKTAVVKWLVAADREQREAESPLLRGAVGPDIGCVENYALEVATSGVTGR